MVYGFGFTTSFGRMLIDSTFYLALGKHFGTSWVLERSKWLPNCRSVGGFISYHCSAVWLVSFCCFLLISHVLRRELTSLTLQLKYTHSRTPLFILLKIYLLGAWEGVQADYSEPGIGRNVCSMENWLLANLFPVCNWKQKMYEHVIWDTQIPNIMFVVVIEKANEHRRPCWFDIKTISQVFSSRIFSVTTNKLLIG